MAFYYFPSCKATAQFKDASRKACEYVKEKYGIAPIGCCRPNHKKLTADDTLHGCHQYGRKERDTSPGTAFPGRMIQHEV